MQDQTLTSAISNLVNSMNTQLANVQGLLERQVPGINALLNKEADEHDELCDHLELLDEQKASLMLQVESLKSQLEAANNQRKDEVSAIHVKLTKAEMELSQLKTVRAELNRLKELNPDGLKKKNVDLKKQVQEKTKSISTLSVENKTLKKGTSTLKYQVTELSTLIKDMNVELEHLREARTHNDGTVQNKAYAGSEGVEFYIYQYEWGLSTKLHGQPIELLGDLNWHIEVRSNIGVNILVMVTDWLHPFYPKCDEIAQHWPEDLNDALAELIRARCEKTHPALVEKVEWSMSVPLSDVYGIKEKDLEKLNAANIHTLYELCRMVPEATVKHVKGMGIKTATAVHQTCMQYVEIWEEQTTEKAA
ncbi:hypothetical protein [Enterovibrio sp. 27052020O]|uniref:hypothetical protein n=1 Tax=Enterovibrio sp. 27052020O TaxID=3241166 RepID=UPI00388E0D0C